MQKGKYYIIFILIAFFGFATPIFAEMVSPNYRIATSVLSGGGTRMNSISYQGSATIGQPSPLMDTQDPPFSDFYDLYPGFWYTIAYYEVPKRAISTPLILLLLNE